MLQGWKGKFYSSPSVVCWSFLQTDLIQIRPDMLSGLIWIQSVSHSDGIPEIIFQKSWFLSGRVAQLVTCLATDRVWLQIQGSRVRSRSGPILLWRLTMKWFLRSFSSLPLIHSRRVVVSYKRKYLHELLVNRLFKPAQEKVWLGELTVPQWP